MEAPVVSRWRSTFGDRSRGVLRAAQFSMSDTRPPGQAIRHMPGQQLSGTIMARGC